jgi:parallel beta-helix repeat protein
MNDITAPVDENCIQIATSSVFVDGDDRTIFGSSEEMSGVITVEGGPYENVHIHDVTVTDFLSGFALFDVTSATIERVESVSAGAYGIYLEQSTSTVITSSTITSAGEDGIKIFEDNNGVTITSSTISGSEVGNGIQVELSNNVTISGNTIFDILGGAGGDGIDVEGVDTLVISNNTISTTTGYGIVIDSFDPDEGDSVENSSIIIATNTISATYEDGMNINYSTTVVISGNTVNGLGEIGQGEDGIDVDNCTNVVVENNIVVDIYDDSYEFEDGINVYINGNTATSTYNGNGIEMEDMSSSTMSMNTFSNLDTDGIYIEDSQNIRITTNTFNNIGQNGIDLDDDGPGNDLVYITYNSFTDIGDQGLEVDDTTNLTIQLNQFSNIGLAEGGSGMNIDDSSNLIITSNTMSNIGRSGMFVEYVDGITIEENTISEYGVNDTFGEITVAGIQLYAASAFDVNNNYIDTDSEYNPAGIYVLEEYEITTNSTITNNIVTTTGRAFYIEETTEAISILGNSMYSDFWVYTATTTNVVFNDEDSGNTYYLGNGTPSWEQFDITDSNGDGWADNGAALPFGVATLGEDLWVGSVVDEHPATLVAYTAPRRSGGGGATIQISRPTPSNNTTATSGSLVLNNNDKETTNRSVRALLFVNNATEMAISNRADFSQSSYMPFSSSFTHTLTPGNGKKTVFIKLRSSDGGTLTISDEIMLTGQVTDAVEDESTSDDEVMIGAEDQPIITPKGPDITIPTNGLQCSTNLVLTTPVRFGLNNNINDVKLLEQFLNTYEGTNLPVNGIYETADFNAVVKWQEKYAADILTPWGLTKGTGYVFTTSLKKIKEIHEKNCATATPVAPSQPAAPISASCLNTQTTLTSGMSGPLVTTAQTLLQKLKLFSATPTGFYGPVTTASVRAFQSANGIDALGIIGPATRAKLNELGC